MAKPKKGKKSPLVFSGRCSHYNLTEPHEPLEVDVIGGNCVASVNDVEYKLAQFDLHAPSEHTVDGKAHDGPVLDALENVNSTAHTQKEAITVHLKSYTKLIKKASKNCGIYNYPGSLTTPACDETADWWVVQTPIQISSSDFTRLHKDLVEYHITDNGNNARPVQRLNGRTVTRYN
ncbi:hypothetical protein PR003_g19088 [Phytophthora rubi]|nr:hypothetical protein PR002_g28330 [Phytophthora rubi]KAE9315053.1 hypothetical protein PR003_g19088 [Phytophthora rubi]